jgi:hypothetical protein
MEINLDSETIEGSVVFDTQEIRAGTEKEFEIKINNPEPWEFIVENCFLADAMGYIKTISYPESIMGRSSESIKLLVTIPKTANNPLKGNLSLKGYFIIK